MGLPVICFDRASGIADILREDPTAADCVIPYCDVAAAAERIVDIAGDPQRQTALSAAVRGIAATTFQMNRYVARLDRLGRGLRIVTDATRVRDYATLKDDSYLTLPSSCRNGYHLSRDDAIRNIWASPRPRWSSANHVQAFIPASMSRLGNSTSKVTHLQTLFAAASHRVHGSSRSYARKRRRMAPRPLKCEWLCICISIIPNCFRRFWTGLPLIGSLRPSNKHKHRRCNCCCRRVFFPRGSA